MQITITIDDSAASEIMQNVALAKGMTSVTDDEVRVAVGADFRSALIALTKRGQDIRKRAEEQSELDDAFAKLIVA